MQAFQPLLEDKRRLLNDKIDEVLSSGFPEEDATELLKYTFRTGGKRLRPILLVLCCEVLGGVAEKALKAAVSLELIHAASLIFDDIIDRDRLRRNLPTSPALFSDGKALSSALFLASKGVEMLSEYKDSKIMGFIGRALVDLSRGEVLDVISNSALSSDRYLTIADLKTGSLFSASAGIGGIIGEGKSVEVDALSNYGRSVGVAFQIRDDILDVLEGSEISQVAAEPSVTYETNLRRERIRQILIGAGGDGPMSSAIRQKALNFAVSASKEYITRGKRFLAPLEYGRDLTILKKFADYALDRNQ